MTKRFRKGLVVGKFSPLTLAHEALIEFAALQCDQVLIFSYSNPEYPKCDRAQRERWLKGRFPQQQVVVVDTASLEREKDSCPSWEIPHDQAHSTTHFKFVTNILVHELGTTVDAVFSSRSDGDSFARHLDLRFKQLVFATHNVVHVPYDIERKHLPIETRRVRESDDPDVVKRSVSSNVYASLMPRLAIVGPSGSGKTELAKALAKELNTAWMSDYMKDLVVKYNNDLRYEDMLHIAQTQIKSELILARRFGNKVLVCDTVPLSTWYACSNRFGRAPNELQRLALKQYDYHVICSPLVQTDAALQEFMWYQTHMENYDKPYHVASGSLEERVSSVRRYINL